MTQGDVNCVYSVVYMYLKCWLGRFYPTIASGRRNNSEQQQEQPGPTLGGQLAKLGGQHCVLVLTFRLQYL